VQLTARQQHDAKAPNYLLALSLPLQGKTKMICIALARLQFLYRRICHRQSVTQVMVEKAANLPQVEVQTYGSFFCTASTFTTTSMLIAYTESFTINFHIYVECTSW